MVLSDQSTGSETDGADDGSEPTGQVAYPHASVAGYADVLANGLSCRRMAILHSSNIIRERHVQLSPEDPMEKAL